MLIMCSSVNNVGQGIAIGLGGILAFAIAPVIGVLAQPILAIKAIAEGILLNYHWNKTRDKNGIALSNHMDEKKKEFPSYMDLNKEFKAEDLTRLEHEKERIEYRDNLFGTLKAMRGLAKCIIPVVGLIWAVFTEVQLGGSVEIRSDVDERYITDAQAIQIHIDKVKRNLLNKNMTNQTPC